VSCELAQTTVHGYFDGELDAVRAAEFERHLENCRECQASLEHMESLLTRLRQADLYERASPQLRERIHKHFRHATGVARASTTSSRRRFLIPAFATLAVAVGFTIAWFLVQAHTEATRTTAELIDAHVRSLQPGHLTDVQSTDQHKVKPWFGGKLDFVPPVSDFAEQGFPLVGGRLDVVDGRNVAAVVYGRRTHTINLFVWPSRNAEPLVGGAGSRQGYNWRSWRADDMQFCLVSDVSAADLRELEGLINR
jgi:anti-sigma factor RsiW